MEDYTIIGKRKKGKQKHIVGGYAVWSKSLDSAKQRVRVINKQKVGRDEFTKKLIKMHKSRNSPFPISYSFI